MWDLFHHMKVDKDLAYCYHQVYIVNNGCLSPWFLKPFLHGPAWQRQDREHVPGPALTTVSGDHICSAAKQSNNLGKCQVHCGKGKLRSSHARMNPLLDTYKIPKQ